MVVKQATRRYRNLSMLQLLRLCKKYGVDYKGIRQIAKETGESRRTVIKLIEEYCIIPNLHAGLLDD